MVSINSTNVLAGCRSFTHNNHIAKAGRGQPSKRCANVALRFDQHHLVLIAIFCSPFLPSDCDPPLLSSNNHELLEKKLLRFGYDEFILIKGKGKLNVSSERRRWLRIFRSTTNGFRFMVRRKHTRVLKSRRQSNHDCNKPCRHVHPHNSH